MTKLLSRSEKVKLTPKILKNTDWLRLKETIKKNYNLWKENPFYPSLEFKQVKPEENIWSVRVGIG